jgi:hypothetical protein
VLHELEVGEELGRDLCERERGRHDSAADHHILGCEVFFHKVRNVVLSGLVLEFGHVDTF